jgi:quercetin dioxygenase-like cupin family protein
MGKSMPDADPPAPSLRKAADFRWAGVELRPYKQGDTAPFKAISRQVLFSDPRMAGELRYFEIEPGGHSTLERHEHMHAVMILRGEGEVLVGAQVQAVRPHDLVTVPPWTWHQFRPSPGETLGFLCLVNVERDRPQLPTAEDVAALRANAEAARFFDGAAGDGFRSRFESRLSHP